MKLLPALACILIASISCAIAVKAANGQIANQTAPDTHPNGVVLQINNNAITSTQIIKTVQEQLRQPAQSLDQDSFIEAALPLIQQTTMTEMYSLLVYQKARREIEQIDNAEEIIQQALDGVRKSILRSYGGSEARAQAELAAQGSSIQDQLQNAEREMVIDAYRNAHLKSSLEFTRSQLLQYYRYNIEQYQQSASLTFALIDIQVDHFLPQDIETPDQQQNQQAQQLAQQTAQQALQQLNNGQDFAQVAQEYSNGFRAALGGTWRPLDPAAITSQYQPIVENVITLNPGQYTDIITAENRFFIAKLIEYQPAQTIPFGQAQFSIIDDLKQQRWQRYSRQLSAELLEQSTLGNIDRFIQDTAVLAYTQLR